MNEIIPEMEQVISQLERGTVVTKFFPKKRPEKKTLMIRRETRQIVWSRSATFRPFDGSVEIREVKEVRVGKQSKDFEKWPEDAKRIENLRCFVVYYGSEFRLKTLSISAFSEKECELWVKGLCHLVQDTINAPYPLQVERRFRKEFYAMESSYDTVNCQIVTNRLRELFQGIDTRDLNHIGFDDFVTLYHEQMYDQNNFADCSKLLNYSNTEQNITLQESQNFLITEQQDNLGNNELETSRFIGEYLQDPQKDVQEPYFTLSEFIDFLFSKQNGIWNQKFNQISQDMTRPLAHYWIASSHDTYLMEDQISSESSCQAYVRALRTGCRCIELDCWDGPDGVSFMFHGHILTIKIKFLDVIKTIKKHAFATSEYPVILSIEDNCTLSQEHKMATTMQKVFGDMLIQPVDKNDTFSRVHETEHVYYDEGAPNDELHFGEKWFHGKLARGREEAEELLRRYSYLGDGTFLVRQCVTFVGDYCLSFWRKGNISHCRIQVKQEMGQTQYYLKKTNCFDSLYSLITHYRNHPFKIREFVITLQEPVPNKPLLLPNKHEEKGWWHPECTRKKAQKILEQIPTNGAFLIRPCETDTNWYAISFRAEKEIKHCKIKLEGRLYTTGTVQFESLVEFVNYYERHPLYKKIKLNQPISQVIIRRLGLSR